MSLKNLAMATVAAASLYLSPQGTANAITEGERDEPMACSIQVIMTDLFKMEMLDCAEVGDSPNGIFDRAVLWARVSESGDKPLLIMVNPNEANSREGMLDDGKTPDTKVYILDQSQVAAFQKKYEEILGRLTSGSIQEIPLP